jgi:uncharacterized membrane protein YdjX (TVP38/TMEM64 family)
MKELTLETIGSEIRRHWKRLALALCFFAIGIAALVWWGEEVRDFWDGARAWLEELNPIGFFVAASILPVFGVSVTLVYVVAGAKFGATVGLGVIAAATAIHLIATHFLTRSIFARPLRRFLHRKGYELPHFDGHRDAAFVVLAALIPGPPYAVRNVLLALSGIPLRRYLGICWTISVLRSGVAIFLGGWSDDPTPRRLTILAIVWAAKLSICGFIVQRLLRRRGRRSA